MIAVSRDQVPLEDLRDHLADAVDDPWSLDPNAVPGVYLVFDDGALCIARLDGPLGGGRDPISCQLPPASSVALAVLPLKWVGGLYTYAAFTDHRPALELRRRITGVDETTWGW